MATAARTFTEFTEEPPTIEIRNGICILRYRSGGCCSERAMSVRDLARAADRAQRALRKHAAGAEHVVIDD